MLPSPRLNRTKSLADVGARSLKIMLFGDWGSGKTYILKELVLRGYKIWVVSTDPGGDGLNTIIIPLVKAGRQELFGNVRITTLGTHQEVLDFLTEPAAFMPDVYDWDPDILVWDGAANWQQVMLSEYVGAKPVEDDPSVAVDSGLMFERAQWGMIRNGTMRGFDKFTGLNNKKTGKIWHKIVTCQEDIRVKSGTTIEKQLPLLQGQGARLAGAAFDLIIRTVKRITTNIDTGEIKKEFRYQIESDNQASKVRGFELPAEMEADPGKLWDMLTNQLGISRDAIDKSAIGPVLLNYGNEEVPSDPVVEQEAVVE